MKKLFYSSLLFFTLFGVGLYAAAHFTEIARIHAVTIDGQLVEDWSERYGLNPKVPIFDQPLNDLATQVLRKRGVVKVDIRYEGTQGLAIRTNEFQPACLAVDRATQLLRGITDEGRVVPLPEGYCEWEQPVLSNVITGPLYDFCSDVRARVIVPQLVRLRSKDSLLFRRLSEIDFSHEGFLIARFHDYPIGAKVIEEQFLAQVAAFSHFISVFLLNTDSIALFDARFGDVVLAVMKTASADSSQKEVDSEVEAVREAPALAMKVQVSDSLRKNSKRGVSSNTTGKATVKQSSGSKGKHQKNSKKLKGAA